MDTRNWIEIFSQVSILRAYYLIQGGGRQPFKLMMKFGFCKLIKRLRIGKV